MTPEQLIETEEEIRRLWEQGDISSLLHLEGSVDGSYERWLCDFFRDNVRPDDWVLASHRCHYVYQLHGGTDLIEKVKAGKSMFCYGPRFICSAIVAGTASIAVGLARSIQERGGSERIFCFMGDGALEHGHALESIFYAHSKNLPIQFMVTDNNSSCGVTKVQRRGSDKEIEWPSCVMKIEYQSRWPHAGSNVRPNLKLK